EAMSGAPRGTSWHANRNIVPKKAGGKKRAPRSGLRGGRQPGRDAAAGGRDVGGSEAAVLVVPLSGAQEVTWRELPEQCPSGARGDRRRRRRSAERHVEEDHHRETCHEPGGGLVLVPLSVRLGNDLPAHHEQH